MDRYAIDQVYALHTLPGVAAGTFETTPGPIMAAVDTLHIEVIGEGGVLSLGRVLSRFPVAMLLGATPAA